MKIKHQLVVSEHKDIVLDNVLIGSDGSSKESKLANEHCTALNAFLGVICTPLIESKVLYIYIM